MHYSAPGIPPPNLPLTVNNLSEVLYHIEHIVNDILIQSLIFFKIGLHGRYQRTDGQTDKTTTVLDR